MKRTIGFLLLNLVWVFGFNAPVDAAGKGKIRVFSETKGAYIYVNGQKKAMTGEGYTNILLPEGEYEIKVEKLSEDGDWIYRGLETVFVGEDTSTKVTIPTKQIPTEKRKKADEEKKRLEAERKRKGGS